MDNFKTSLNIALHPRQKTKLKKIRDSTKLCLSAKQKPLHFDFKAFFENFKQVYPQHKAPSKKWLAWFIGFVEGDGSFMVTNFCLCAKAKVEKTAFLL
jgi:hypothetical protein